MASLAAGAVIFILMLAFLAGIIYFAVVLPTIALVDCSKSKEAGQPASSKAVWIGAMLIFWPVAGYAYAILYMKPKYRNLSYAAVGAAVAFVLSLPWGLHLLEEQYDLKFLSLQSRVEGQLLLTTDQKKEVVEDIHEVKSEVHGLRWYDVQRKLTLMSLTDLLSVYLEQGDLTSEQYADWTSKFKSRESLDNKELADYVKEKESRAPAAAGP